MPISVGDKFIIRVYNVNKIPIGYVFFEQVSTNPGIEYVLSISPPDINAASRFELLGSEPVQVPPGEASGFIVKALVPGSVLGGPGPGDYILREGDGNMFNGLLYGTSEYNKNGRWHLLYADCNTATELCAVNTPYIPDGIFSCNIIAAVRRITTPFRVGSHSRTVQKNELRFGIWVGDPVYFSFQKV